MRFNISLGADTQQQVAASRRLLRADGLQRWASRTLPFLALRRYPFGYNGAMFTVQQTQEFQDWLDGLKDIKAQLRIVARLRLAEAGNLGDWKSVGSEVSEMRISYGPGYRLYFTRRQNILIVMLAGGDKSTQARDIKRAQKILQQLELDS